MKEGWKTETQEKMSKFASWKKFPKFHHKLSNSSSGIHEIPEVNEIKALLQFFMFQVSLSVASFLLH